MSSFSINPILVVSEVLEVVGVVVIGKYVRDKYRKSDWLKSLLDEFIFRISKFGRSLKGRSCH
jgi:hypothetical protein